MWPLCLWWWLNGRKQPLFMLNEMLNQILRWPKKEKVVRLVCLTSSIVGLVCYARSSAFNHLLGNWSWWKMLLYIVFSFIVGLAVLFSPARSSSTSPRLEVHLAFLVLIITSFYSFFLDKVKGKPDAYGIISWAAFAVMSLGMSNLTQFGFQIDLLYFFCGVLTVQLMKIELWLVIVGGVFSYSLLQLRDYSVDTQNENLVQSQLQDYSGDTQDEDLEQHQLQDYPADTQEENLQLNQILRWPKKEKVVRLVCLASSVVGLLCYAHSSSFNHLLGNWSWWKMLLYIVFSFIVGLAVLFAPARSSSTSPRLEVHLAFLVLIITSFYSFFLDEVKGKPDAYDIISCAAFAVMSLGMSNLTQFGFQIDLLYFFCGVLIVQLMKIELWLVIVGGVFSYSLLQLRDYLADTQNENLVQRQLRDYPGDTQDENLEQHQLRDYPADTQEENLHIPAHYCWWCLRSKIFWTLKFRVISVGNSNQRKKFHMG